MNYKKMILLCASRNFRTILLAFILTGGILYSPAAMAYSFKDCNQEAKKELSLAADYLIDNMRILKKDYEFDMNLPRGVKRVKRRMSRKIKGRLQIHCATGNPRCAGDAHGKSWGTLTKRIHICYKKAKNNGWDFCRLTGLLAHEYAHSIGMRVRVVPHNNGAEDKVRQYGYFARELCRQDGIRRSLGEASDHLVLNRSRPTSGVVVFSKKNYKLRGQNLTGAHADLRQIGRNNSISSIKVLSGSWEVCQRTNYRGWCHKIDRDVNNIKKIKFNNKISSIRSARTRGSGITVYRKNDYGGGYQHFTGAMPNLKDAKVNNKIASIRVHSGSWELCKKKNYRGKCRTFRGAQNLKGTGLRNKVSSLRPR